MTKIAISSDRRTQIQAMTVILLDCTAKCNAMELDREFYFLELARQMNERGCEVTADELEAILA